MGLGTGPVANLEETLKPYFYQIIIIKMTVIIKKIIIIET